MAHVFFDLTDLPADFGNAESGSITVRTRGVDVGTTPTRLFAQLFQANETTPLSDEIEVAAYGTFVEDDFTGDDDDPWNPAIWIDDDMANASSTIQGNEGQLEVFGTSSIEGTARQRTDTFHGDFDALFKHRFAGGFDEDKRFAFGFRRTSEWKTTGGPGGPLNGYQLVHFQANNRVGLFRYDDPEGAATEIVDSTSIDRTLTHWFRVRAVGDSIRVKWWEDGTAEPDTWNLDTGDDTFLTGVAFSFVHHRQGGSGTRQAIVDDVAIHPIGAGGGGAFANRQIVFTGLDTTAGKSIWDNARVRFRWGT